MCTFFTITACTMAPTRLAFRNAPRIQPPSFLTEDYAFYCFQKKQRNSYFSSWEQQGSDFMTGLIHQPWKSGSSQPPFQASSRTFCTKDFSLPSTILSCKLAENPTSQDSLFRKYHFWFHLFPPTQTSYIKLASGLFKVSLLEDTRRKL